MLMFGWWKMVDFVVRCLEGKVNLPEARYLSTLVRLVLRLWPKGKVNKYCAFTNGDNYTSQNHQWLFKVGMPCLNISRENKSTCI